MLTLQDQEGPDDPLHALLGPHCSSHQVLLNLERAQGIETSGISWLMRTNERFIQARGPLSSCIPCRRPSATSSTSCA